MDYVELVKGLREHAERFNYDGWIDTAIWFEKAADAIELLQTYKVAFETIISTGGWWLVGQDKNLYRMDVPMNWPPEGTKAVEVFPLNSSQRRKKAEETE